LESIYVSTVRNSAWLVVEPSATADGTDAL